MNFYLSIPFLFVRFWFLGAPIRLTKYFLSVNHALLQILSLPLLVKTFFRPLKNEYRKGLVIFSFFFGIIVKTAFIFVDLILLSFVVIAEVLVIIFFVTWPFLLFLIFLI